MLGVRRGRPLGVALNRCKKGNVFDALKDGFRAFEELLEGYGPLVTLGGFAFAFVLGGSLVGFGIALSVLVTLLTWWPRGGLTWRP